MKLQKIMMSLVFGGLILLMLVLAVLNGFI